MATRGILFFNVDARSCGQSDRFPDIGNKVSPAVHGCTSSNAENESLSLFLSFFPYLTCVYTEACVRRLPLRLSKSEFSASSTYSRLARAASSGHLALFLSLAIFLSLSRARSFSLPHRLFVFPLECVRAPSPFLGLSLGDGNERVRIEASRRALSVGRRKERTLSKCYPLSSSVPLCRLSISRSFSLSFRLFSACLSSDLSVAPVERRSTYRRTA